MGDLTGRGRRDEIRAIKRVVEDELLARPEVVGVDINEKRARGRATGWLAIVISVRRKLPLGEIPRGQVFPGRIGGVPTDIVEEEPVLHRLLQCESQAAHAMPTPVSETIQGGLSIGPGRAMWMAPPEVPAAGEYVTVGTLGALVTDRRGHVLGLTNFHVACVDDAWAVGDVMLHPARVDGGRPRADAVGALARAALSGSVDGAVVQLAAGRRYEAAISGIGPVRGTARAELGGAVRKCGRSTGLTDGVVVSVDATIALEYGDGIGRRVLREQIRIRRGRGHRTIPRSTGFWPYGARRWVSSQPQEKPRFGDHGDSGAVVVNAENRVIGLYVGGTAAGDGFANRIGAVLRALDVELCLGTDVYNRN